MARIEAKSNAYYIFGAHSRGQTMAIYMGKLCPEYTFLGFLYDNGEANPNEIAGYPVIDIRKEKKIDKKARVYVAVRSVHSEHILESLKTIGFTDVVLVDVDLDNKLRNDFVREYFKDRGRSFAKIDEMVKEAKKPASGGSALVYVVKSAFDAALKKNVDLNYYESYIQAGRALTDTVLDDCAFHDDTGDSISDRNRQMCELTAMYWIWKNAEQEIVGIEHYRRRFILPKEWENVFTDKEADIILPVPLYVRPSLKENYISRHLASMWDCMMNKLKELYGDAYVETAKEFFEENGCYSPCNMLIARKEVLDELCTWMFPVIFGVMDVCGEVDDNYQNRYPGFLSERLISFYFYYYKNKYKVVYADKIFLT